MANEFAVNKADLQKVADSIKNAAGTTQKLAFPDGWSDIVGTLGAQDGRINKYVGDSFDLVYFTDLNGNVVSVTSAPEGIVSIDISSGEYAVVTALNVGLTTITITTDASENNEYKYVVNVNFARYSGAYKVTPGRTEQVLPTKNKGLSDNITVVGEPNLLPENIKAGTTIFGIPGTHSINVDINLTVGSSATVSGEDFKSENAIIDPTKSITITPTGVVTAEWDMDTDVKITAVAVGMATVYLPSPDGGIAAQIIVSVNSSGGSSGSAKLVDAEFTANGEYTPTSYGELIGSQIDGFKKVTVKVPVLELDEPLEVTANGMYQAGAGKAYNTVIVNVPGIIPTGTALINSNGIHDVAGRAKAEVNVQPNLEKLDTITKNGTYKPSTDYDGFTEFVVNVPVESPQLEELGTITENGTYKPSAGYDGFSEFVVNVPTGITLPTFSVDGSNYNFVEGLTWGGWLECVLNEDNFTYDDSLGAIITNTSKIICVSSEDLTSVTLTDKIIANRIYGTVQM